MDDFELASALTGASRAEKVATNPTHITMISGVATSDSADGKVTVNLGGDAVTSDGLQQIEVSTSVSVKQGDMVRVTLVGTDGTAKDPLVTDIVGGGDRAQDEIDSANQTAASAQDTAQSVKNYFFSDTTGAHITRTAGAPDTGRNVLIDTNHFCFRDAKTILMEIATNMISLGADSKTAIIKLCKDTLRIYGRSEGSITDINLSADVGADSAPHYAGVILGLADFSTSTNYDAYIGIKHEVSGSNRSTTAMCTADYVDVAGLKVPISKLRHVLSETELYNNESTAFNAGVTLSETAANFTDIEIYFKNNDGFYSSVKVHNPDGKQAVLVSANPQAANSTLYFKGRVVYISGTSINTQSVGGSLDIGEVKLQNGQAISYLANNVIAITRVVGWRY